MNAADQRELEQVALAGELAGQLRHDVGSFVYHVCVKLELLEALPDQPRDWESIKREGKQLIEQLREWDQYRGSPDEPTEIDLNHLVEDTVRKFHRDGLQSRITVKPASKTTLLVTRTGEARRLLELLLIHSILSSRADDEKNWALSVATHAGPCAIQFRVGGVASAGARDLLDEDNGDEIQTPSLAVKTCRSLAVRLDAKLSAECQPDGKLTIVVEFCTPGHNQ